jgi:hypothetical protein
MNDLKFTTAGDYMDYSTIKRLKEKAIEECLKSDFETYPIGFADKFMEHIVQECISEVALMGIAYYDNNDISETCMTIIENIRNKFK